MKTMFTAPLRTEHQALLAGVEAIDAATLDLDDWSPEDADARLSSIVDFLRRQLLPHARAEENVLYPAIDDELGAPGAMATMTAEHAEIVVRTDRLAGTIEEVDEWWSDARFRREVARQLAGLGALIASHFHKEEAVLFPILDAALTPDTASDLFDRMHHGAG